VALADVYFSPAHNQKAVRRPPVIAYIALAMPTDVTAYALVAILALPPLLRRARRGLTGP
jgi:hypothetical protein